MGATRTDGRAYIVCDGETMTWADLCRPIAKALGCDLKDIDVAGPAFRTELAARLQESGALRQLARIFRTSQRRTAPVIAEMAAENAGAVSRPAGFEKKNVLHTGRVRLPARAERELGYRSDRDFDKACRQCVGWLAFAGYPSGPGEGTTGPMTGRADAARE